jgi:hypothetical protein
VCDRVVTLDCGRLTMPAVERPAPITILQARVRRPARVAA